jgi:hypothetical protein
VARAAVGARTGFQASVSGGFHVSDSYADGWATSGYEHL